MSDMEHGVTTQRVTWDDSVLERALTKLLVLRDATEADDQRAAAAAFATDDLAVMATIDTLRAVLRRAAIDEALSGARATAPESGGGLADA